MLGVRVFLIIKDGADENHDLANGNLLRES
jgi:hypothetical protein